MGKIRVLAHGASALRTDKAGPLPGFAPVAVVAEDVPTVRTVRIYGLSKNVAQAPPAPKGVEVWCINNPRGFGIQRFAAMHEWTRWFNMHTKRHQQLAYKRGYEWYTRQTKPIYLQEVDPQIPSSVRFPREALQEFFKTSRKPQRYFTCSGAWLIALAVYEGFERIDIWGHQMKITGEHAFQRPGFQWWVEEARRRGVDVRVPKGAIGHPEGDGTPIRMEDPNMYTGPLYGYEPHSQFYRDTF